MNIEVHITKVLQPRTGTSKNGNPFTIYQFIGATFEQYSRNIAFTLISNETLPQDRNAWGSKTCPVPYEGADVDIHFDLETRIFQKRDGSDGYDTVVKPYRLVSLDNADPNAAAAQPQQVLNAQPQYAAPSGFAAPVPPASAGGYPPQQYPPQQSVFPGYSQQ